VHLFDVSDARDFLSNGFTFTANAPLITDCSPGLGKGKDSADRPFKGTCSAWTYMRKDLLPMTLNNPQTAKDANGIIQPTNLCLGVIIDPSKIWKYISTMGASDSDTDHRSNGENYYDFPVEAMFNCFPHETEPTGRQLWVENRELGRAAGCTPAGTNCPQTDCDPTKMTPAQYTVCRSGNSGGGVNFSNYGCAMWDLACKGAQPDASRDPNMRSNWGCSNCQMRTVEPGSDYSAEQLAKTCDISLMPHMCVAQDPPIGGEGWQNYWSYQALELAGSNPERFDRAVNYVGANSKNFYSLATDVDAIGKPSGLSEPSQVSLTQCKFQRDDWKDWISAIKQIYQAWYDNYNSDGKLLTTKWGNNTDAKKLMYNYLMGCNSWIYLENEVNLYFRPLLSPPGTRQDYHDKQDADLRDAVLGFFYVEDTCLEMLKDLEGITCTDFSGKARTTARDRCEAFACGNADYTDNEKKACIDANVTNEKNNIGCRYDLAKSFVDQFNATYRKNGPAVQLYKYKGSTSVYYKHADLEGILTGQKEITGDHVFIPVTGRPAEYAKCSIPNQSSQFPQSHMWRRAQASTAAALAARGPPSR